MLLILIALTFLSVLIENLVAIIGYQAVPDLEFLDADNPRSMANSK